MSDSGVLIVHGTQELRLGSRRPSPFGFFQPKAFFLIWGPSMQIWKWKTRCFKLNIILFGNVYSTSKASVYLWCKLSSEAYSALLKAIPGANNSVTQDAQAIKPFPDVASLNWDDYPNIKFWFKRQWIESLNDHVTDITLPVGPQCGRARASLNVNIAMRYVEMERSDLIDGDRASEIRKICTRDLGVIWKKGTVYFSNFGLWLGNT